MTKRAGPVHSPELIPPGRPRDAAREPPVAARVQPRARAATPRCDLGHPRAPEPEWSVCQVGTLVVSKPSLGARQARGFSRLDLSWFGALARSPAWCEHALVCLVRRVCFGASSEHR